MMKPFACFHLYFCKRKTYPSINMKPMNLNKLLRTHTTFNVFSFWIFFLLFSFNSTNVRSEGLGDLAAKAGLTYGTMVHKPQFMGTDPVYKQTLINEFKMTFPENEIKWSEIEPTQGVFKFTYPDSVIAFAQANGMKSRGHFMIWHTNLPYWLTSRSTGANKWTRTQLLDILKTHIFTVIGHFRGKISEYDVVNEPFNIGYNKPFGLRNSFWYDIIGPEYIDSAFVWAHRADPQAYLYLNEYGAEGAAASEYPKRDSLYKYVKDMVARGVPIHGVGFEGHFGNYINSGTISANIKKLGELGLRVSITELDMMHTTNIPQNWVNLMNACLENYNCTTFVTWGVDDANSWMGSDCGCLVWDTLFQKKPAIYNGLANALRNANPTTSARRKAFSAELPFPQTPIPEVSPEIIYCQGETAATLTAVGTKLKWYANATTNVVMFAPTPSTKTPGTTSYFVSQTLNLIESRRSEIKVTVNAPTTWYKDEDGDGKGDPSITLISCTQPVGYAKDVWTAISTTKAEQVQIIAYPQPFKSFTTIRLSNGEILKSATVLNISGAIMEEKKDINTKEVVLGESLISGIYSATIRTENNTYNVKIVKL